MAETLNNMQNIDIYNSYTSLPSNMITAELEGIYGSTLTQEMSQIIKLYDIYEKGADFPIDVGKGNYIPSDLKCKKAKKLIDEEARFMFSKPVDFTIKPEGKLDEQADKKEVKEKISILQSLVDTVLRNNNFNSKVLKAAKDCFIGKRIALMLNFNEEGIKLQFAPSLEFVYDTDENDINMLKKLVCFFTVKDDKDKGNQRIYKKKYWMENGFCHVHEAIYDGNGTLKETMIEDMTTKFLYIPGTVIINDGLTGDMLGSSDILQVADFESKYSKYSNSDLDAERMSMNPIRWARDMNPESTKDLSIAPGAFWDLSSDVDNDMAGEVGQLESNMAYSNALDTTLKRIENNMYEQLSIPNVNLDTIKGIITSGKGMKAIYWPLIVRCDEKMLEWKRALEFMADCIIDGAILYPESTKYYTVDEIPDIDYSVEVENNYSLPEDEVEEKTMDIQEVNAQTMSRRTYMKKWRRLTDDEADIELKQIALEKQMFEDSYIDENATIEEEDLDTNKNDVEDISKKPDDTQIKQNL